MVENPADPSPSLTPPCSFVRFVQCSVSAAMVVVTTNQCQHWVNPNAVHARHWFAFSSSVF